jgi:hypothetical protein
MKPEKANFHTGAVLIERQIWKAGSAIGLFNTIIQYGATLSSTDKVSPFLHATQAAAWTASIVACYTLIDDSRSLTLPKLINKLGAQPDPHNKGSSFLSTTARAELMTDVASLKYLLPHIKNLRNYEEGHTPNHLSFRILDEKPKAEKDIELFYNGCVKIMNKVHKERGRQYPREKFEAAICASFRKLLGCSESPFPAAVKARRA